MKTIKKIFYIKKKKHCDFKQLHVPILLVQEQVQLLRNKIHDELLQKIFFMQEKEQFLKDYQEKLHNELVLKEQIAILQQENNKLRAATSSTKVDFKDI